VLCISVHVVVIAIECQLFFAPPSVGGLDLDSRSSGCARLGGGVGPIFFSFALIECAHEPCFVSALLCCHWLFIVVIMHCSACGRYRYRCYSSLQCMWSLSSASVAFIECVHEPCFVSASLCLSLMVRRYCYRAALFQSGRAHTLLVQCSALIGSRVDVIHVYVDAHLLERVFCLACRHALLPHQPRLQRVHVVGPPEAQSGRKKRAVQRERRVNVHLMSHEHNAILCVPCELCAALTVRSSQRASATQSAAPVP